MNIKYYFVGLALLSILQFGCAASRPNTTAGGLFGGMTGGVLGAAIGAHDGKVKEGALIGAAAGGLAGLALGDQADQAESRNLQLANQQAAITQESMVTIGQVIQMSQSGLSDELILNQVNANGFAQKLSTNDLIQLKSTGVSDNVIHRLQTIGIQTIGIQPIVQPRPIMHGSSPTIYADPYCPSAFHPPNFNDRPVLIQRPVGRRTRAGFTINL
jgi:hypothetical protein